MIPRAVRQTQAAGSASFRFISSSSSSLRSASTFAPRSRSSALLQPHTQSIKPFPPRLAQRYYSTEKDGKEATETASNDEDAAQKELEAKKKEVVELKVSLELLPYSQLL
jgi:molecular chaperone GrpE